MSGPPPDGLTDTHMLVLACFAPEPFASPQDVAEALGLPVAAMLVADPRAAAILEPAPISVAWRRRGRSARPWGQANGVLHRLAMRLLRQGRRPSNPR